MILYHTDLKFRSVDAAQPTQILPNALLNERKPIQNRRHIISYYQEPASPHLDAALPFEQY